MGYKGQLTRGTHACVRSSDAGKVCRNFDGGYECIDCDVGGAEAMQGQTGTIWSHRFQNFGAKYANDLIKEWYIKVDLGYHVELTIHEFSVSNYKCLVDVG